MKYEFYFDKRRLKDDHVTRYDVAPDSTAPAHPDRGHAGRPGALDLSPNGPGDRRLSFEVAIDHRSLPDLRGATIDFVDTLQKTGFIIDNPNARSGCACGDSFC